MKKADHKTSAYCLLPSAFPCGFTLVELMIVMMIISIMVGITIPISRYVTLRARQANQKIYIEKIKGALEDYRAAYGEYPITPVTNPITGQVINYADAVRHYPPNYNTECYYTSNSPYTTITLANSTVEKITTSSSTENKIDYCLTYPLMLRQLAAGARPFMQFNEVTVTYLVYKGTEVELASSFTRKRKRRSGGYYDVPFLRILGNPVNRAKAIDPVSQKQWKYVSEDGVTYTLTNHTEKGF